MMLSTTPYPALTDPDDVVEVPFGRPGGGGIGDLANHIPGIAPGAGSDTSRTRPTCRCRSRSCRRSRAKVAASTRRPRTISACRAAAGPQNQPVSCDTVGWSGRRADHITVQCFTFFAWARLAFGGLRRSAAGSPDRCHAREPELGRRQFTGWFDSTSAALPGGWPSSSF